MARWTASSVGGAESMIVVIVETASWGVVVWVVAEVDVDVVCVPAEAVIGCVWVLA